MLSVVVVVAAAASGAQSIRMTQSAFPAQCARAPPPRRRWRGVDSEVIYWVVL